MDFSSKVPLFLDPLTWHQGVERQITNQMQPSSSGFIPSNPLQISPPSSGGGSGPGSIKPGSMVDRARLAQVPLPESGLECPRCKSTHTKFCYFNNYNLSQPRHFCKGCRRYWTRGGALRNVPVGGGCRRNKRSKPKSRTGSKADPVPAQIIRRVGSSSTTSSSANDLSSQMILPPSHPVPFLTGLHHLNGYGNGYGLNLGGGGSGTRDAEQLSGFHGGSGVTGNGLYPFDESVIPGHSNSGFGRLKMDENHQGLNLYKNFMSGNNNIGDQYSSWLGSWN